MFSKWSVASGWSEGSTVLDLCAGKLLEVNQCRERGKCTCGHFRKSVHCLKKCAGELPTVPASDQDPTRLLHDDLGSRRPLGVALVSVKVITGMVLSAGSRMKTEASRDRARVDATVRKWALEAVMDSKKAAHAYLKGSETSNTPAGRGSPRWRDAVRPQRVGDIAGRREGQNLAARQG